MESWWLRDERFNGEVLLMVVGRRYGMNRSFKVDLIGDVGGGSWGKV